MSRIRTVKPDFWVSEQVISCSPLARLAFIGMWNFCDDNGVHPASYVRLRAEVFPGDNYSIDEIKSWIAELITVELIREYAVSDKMYWIVTGWKKHQRIDRPTYKYPLPSTDFKKIADASPDNHRIFDEYSPSNPRLTHDSSTTEGKGMEGNGKEKNISESEASPVSDADVIFHYWQQVMHHPRAKLDHKRERVIKHALQLGYSIDDLKQAIDGCASTPFNMGQNDRKQRYDDLELILRDASHIDRFISNTAAKLIPDSGALMAGVL